MAETYHVLNWRELPLRTAAVLASGLHEDSRTIRKLNGQIIGTDHILQLGILDELRMLVWAQTKDAAKGRNRPESMLAAAMARKEKPKVTGFRSPEEFEARKRKIIEGA